MDQIQKNIPLSGLTTLEIGGPASYYVEVFDEAKLLEVINYAGKEKIDYQVIGGGSNLLVADEGIDKLIIKNSQTGIERKDDFVVVKGGTILEDLIAFTIDNDFAGMHKLIGIPGTVGGAIYGNAGAYGQTISEHLVTVHGLKDGEVVTLSKSQCEFAYRDSGFKRNSIVILEATLKLPSGDKESLRAESEQIQKTRLAKYHPGIKCPGSFFKNVVASDLNPEQLGKIPTEKIVYGKIPAGYLLESVGAKGDRLGQIEVAPYHGNLFINRGAGTAKDFYALAAKWQTAVKDKFKIELEPEVQLINLPPLQNR